jgi:hypothetical protein
MPGFIQAMDSMLTFLKSFVTLELSPDLVLAGDGGTMASSGASPERVVDYPDLASKPSCVSLL